MNPRTAWLLFWIVVVVALGIDIVANRRALTMRRALTRTVAWIVLGLSFAVVVAITLGARGAHEYVAAFLIEKTLSLDNLAAFVVIFRSLGVSTTLQHRVLTVGIAGALVTRGAFIVVGTSLMQRWHAATYVLAGILVLTAVRSALGNESQPRVLALAHRLRVAPVDGRGAFFMRSDGHWRATTLAVAVIAIEVTDIVFSFDSIPSALAITTRPFVLYTSNVFAVLGLRALFVVVAKVIERVSWVKYGVAGLLLLTALKIGVSSVFVVPPVLMSSMTLALLAVLVLAGALTR